MPSIYTHADSNTRKTWFLITGFLVFIIVVGWLFSYVLNSSAILVLAVFLSVGMSVTSYWYSDKIVLRMANAMPVEKKDSPELYRLVENLCITAGLPLPKIYIINESQLNAFATGRDKNHAVVAVTRGLLEKLDKTELEGVIAHELSHIGNRDMLLGTVMVILVGIIAIVSDLFFRMSFWGGNRRNSRNGNAGALLMVVGILAAILSPIAATLIKLAVSRKREFLADADGALLTRYPEGLASALQKISDDVTPMRSAHAATAHLYIDSPFNEKQSHSWFVKLFQTHPPVEDRIKALKDIQV